VVLPLLGGRLYVQYDAHLSENRANDHTVLALGLALLMIALAAPLTQHLAAALVAPIERVTQRLDRWAPAPSDEPAATQPVNEEQRLHAAFERVQARLEQALAREPLLLADLRHELCTPLTALRTDLEMLSLNHASPSTRVCSALWPRSMP